MGKVQNSKERILDCTEELVAEIGAANVSLDAIAERAKISKGGLLYNFPCKEILLKSMVARLVENFAKYQQQVRDELPNTPGRDLKAYIIVCMEINDEKNRFRIKNNVGIGLLAAIANNPKLVAPIREDHKKRLESFQQSFMGFEKSAILAYAAEGILLHELLQIYPFEPESKNSILKRLLEWIEEEEAKFLSNSATAD